MRRAKRGRPRAQRGSGKGGTAAVLSVLMPGLGHVYAGQVAVGLGIMAGSPVAVLAAWLILAPVASGVSRGGGALVFLAAPVAVWVWQVYAAFRAGEAAR